MTFQISHPSNANARNSNARNGNACSQLPDKEVSNVEFRSMIQMLSQSFTNQNNQRVQDMSMEIVDRWKQGSVTLLD